MIFVDSKAHFEIPDEKEMERFGAAMASVIEGGMVFHLEGALGVGKTTLVRSILRALGFEGPVKSPSYSLVEFYVVSRLYFYHFDFFDCGRFFIGDGLWLFNGRGGIYE